MVFAMLRGVGRDRGVLGRGYAVGDLTPQKGGIFVMTHQTRQSAELGEMLYVVQKHLKERGKSSNKHQRADLTAKRKSFFFDC